MTRSAPPAETSPTRILVTGGAGYIASHTLIELIAGGHHPVVLDNFANSTAEAVQRASRIAGAEIPVEAADIRDGEALAAIFARHAPEAVIHFAGLKAVGESATDPLAYYDNNVTGTLRLLKAMDAAGCRRMIFSSSATVYGDARYLPIDEAHPVAPVNPYGRTKLFIEEILADWQAATADSSAVILRYFNPVGAHASGTIGEDPRGVPNNLLPFIAQVAVGRRPELAVFGNDYDTRDGTGLRDYIHVVDLARAHVAALDYGTGHPGTEIFNVGTGAGVTVLELVAAFEAASGRPIPFRVVARRPGDTPSSLANAEKAERLLGWRATHDLADMCASAWAWQSANPKGYATG